MPKGKVYLIPTSIALATESETILPGTKDRIKTLDYFLVENARSARRFISSLKLGLVIEKLRFEVLDKNTNQQQVERYLEVVKQGKDVGIMSEAGCPGIADPGSLAVNIAHRLSLQVIPLVGPSSILLALMGSGFNGQCFKFHGYLSIKSSERILQLKTLEKESQRLDQSQIFIETPYRNDKLLEDIINNCAANVKLCIAKNLTSEEEFIKSSTIARWKGNLPSLHKVPCVFILYAGKS